MLRRRMLMIIASSYRWASSKFSAVLGNWAKPVVTSAVEAESERSTVIRRKAIGRNQPAEVGNAADYSVLGRVANPDVYEAAEGIGLKQLIVRCKSFAYSALEVPGIGGVRVIMLRLANAVIALGKAASSALLVVGRGHAIGESAGTTEANSAKGIKHNVKSDATAVSGREALSEILTSIGKAVEAIAAPAVLASSVSELQNGEHNRPALYLKNYMDGNVLVLLQAHNAILTGDVLGVTCVENYANADDVVMWQVYDAIPAGNVLGVTCSENYANDDNLALWQTHDATQVDDTLEVS